MKNSLRKELLNKRDAIPADIRRLKDASIKKRLFDLDVFNKAETVLIYASFRSEVDTISYLQDILKTGKRLTAPLVDSALKSLTLYEIRDPSELAPGYMGIPEPAVSKDRVVNLDDIDLVVIPGSGFDPEGNRLGYGGGYYDRLLSREKTPVTTVALAYEEQITDNIPAEPHDMKVDMIVTDERVIECSS